MPLRPFRNLSIRQKLTLLIIAIAAVALALMSGALFTYELLRFRHAIVRDVSSQADVIGGNAASGLAFNVRRDADEALAPLASRPDILRAVLYTTNGEIFAAYPTNQIATDPSGFAPKAGHAFKGSHLIVVRPMTWRNDLAGFILMEVSLQEQHTRLANYAGILVALTAVSLFVAWLLGARLQRAVSGPLLELSRTAEAVRAEQDYSLRASKHNSDEIGRLVDGFNQMLAQIEKRDDALRASEERFRQMADSIRQVFWLSDVAKNEMIYISPAYEEIWGRTCASLYEQPRSWIEAIHPEDRDRVWNAARTKQASGEYDEEYRIVRPDGALRWIRDRAFPISETPGKITRIAGVAEDITKEKLAAAERQRLVSLVENSRDFVGVAAMDGTILFINTAGLRMVGLDDLAEARRKQIRDFYFDHDWSAYQNEIFPIVLNAGHWEGQGQLRHCKTGAAIDVEVSSFLIKDPMTGQPLGLATVRRDITERKKLEREVMEVTDREQARISQDIHDGLCQILVSTGLTASLLEQKLQGISKNEAAQAREIVDLIDESIAQARNLVGGLFPARLEDEGLSSALHEFVHRLSRRQDIRFTIDCPERVNINLTQATHLFRIAQEALNNVVKHAAAKRAGVRIEERKEAVVLTVTDDGVGLPKDSSPQGGFGLRFMRYRAGMIGAKLTVAPGPNGGTVLTCAVPKV